MGAEFTSDELRQLGLRLEAAEGRERGLREVLERIAEWRLNINGDCVAEARALAQAALSTPDPLPESELDGMRRVCEAAREYEQHLERAVTHWRNRRGGDETDAIMTTYYIDAWRSAQESFAEVAEALAAWKEVGLL